MHRLLIRLDKILIFTGKYGIKKTSRPKVIKCINRNPKFFNLRARFVKICKNVLTRKWLIAESSILKREIIHIDHTAGGATQQNLVQGRVNPQVIRA
jgi:hypothetical protein